MSQDHFRRKILLQNTIDENRGGGEQEIPHSTNPGVKVDLNMIFFSFKKEQRRKRKVEKKRKEEKKKKKPLQTTY